MVPGQVIISMKKMNLDSYFTSYITLNSKWIMEIYVRAKTIKEILEENSEAKLYDLG